MSMKSGLMLTLLLANLTAVAAGVVTARAETYQWTDSQGNMHFSDNPASVPRSQKVKVQLREDITTLNPDVRDSLKQSQRRSAELEREERDRRRQRQINEYREAQEGRVREAQEKVRREAQLQREQKEAQDLKRRLSTAPIQTAVGGGTFTTRGGGST